VWKCNDSNFSKTILLNFAYFEVNRLFNGHFEFEFSIIQQKCIFRPLQIQPDLRK
jgi:hypothetical protein